ncbi:pectinesterase inhibitor 1-like [Cucurbita moschata]|uniref:Pectinesterase inhibitor 1-like n=1 Tax=Cucurbita moschata TaxID=3662 RepID=A0A6J1H6C1_CUCMO|nr:pectinesterase inhibitor 1-like [Cucurbita moschata]
MVDLMLHLAHTSVVECRRRVQQLEAEETVNPKLKKRYSECLESTNSSVNAIEVGKQHLAFGGYIVVTIQVIGATNDVDQCLDTFNQPSSLPKNVKNLRDICDIASYVAHTLAGDDY